MEAVREVLFWWLSWWIQKPVLNALITVCAIGFFAFSLYTGWAN